MVRRAQDRHADGMNSDIHTLTRSSTDRKVSGVAGGLGEYFGVDPVLFRIGFAVATLASGVGAVAYLLLLAFVKPDDAPDHTASPLPA
jgi:phage shock protein PspC (stress-responsive transcriptional regulator)